LINADSSSARHKLEFVLALFPNFFGLDAQDLALRRAAAQLLGKARSAGLAVRLFHANNSIITGVDTWISPIRVDAIEVTQAIQNL
jgi:hypothetical protein